MELAKLIRVYITKTRKIEEARQMGEQYEQITRTTGIGVEENNGE